MNYAEIITEEIEELQQLLKQQKAARYEKRVRFLYLLKTASAKTQKAAGEQVGWKLRQAQKIWQQYRDAGLAAILESPRKDSLGNLSSQEIARLLRYLSEFGFSSLEEAQSYIAKSFGTSYTIGGVSWLFKRLQVKLKTARPVNVRKDERRVEAYKKTLAV